MLGLPNSSSRESLAEEDEPEAAPIIYNYGEVRNESKVIYFSYIPTSAELSLMIHKALKEKESSDKKTKKMKHLAFNSIEKTINKLKAEKPLGYAQGLGQAEKLIENYHQTIE